MQIVPNSGSWTNSAASQQIATSTSNGSKATSKATAVGLDLRLEQSEKSADRDAQERYAGRESNSAVPNTDEQLRNDEHSESMLDLPACEAGEPSLLDLLG